MKERKREHNALRSTNVVRGAVVEWKLDTEQFNEVTDKYFDDKDRRLLVAIK